MAAESNASMLLVLHVHVHVCILWLGHAPHLAQVVQIYKNNLLGASFDI